MGSVHVPECSEDGCQSFLQQVRLTLEQHNITPVTKYSPGGLFKDHFCSAFSSSSCTIIHICSELMNRVKRVLDVLEQDQTKAWFVWIKPKANEFQDFDFLHDYNISDGISEEGRQLFLKQLVERAVSCTGGSDLSNSGTTSGSSLNGDVPNEASQQSRPQSGSDVDLFDGQSCCDFQPLPLVLRVGTASNTMVNKQFLDLKPTAAATVDVKSLSRDKKASVEKADGFAIEASLEVLPALLANQDLVWLAHFVCSKHTTLQFQALQMIGWLLLEQSACLTLATLLEVEGILYDTMEGQWKRSVNLKDTKQPPKLLNVNHGSQYQEFLVCVYLMLLSVILLQGADSKQGDATLETVLQRYLFKEGSIRQRLPTGPGWRKAVKSCLTVWKQLSCLKVKETVMQTGSSTQQAAKLKDQLKIPLLVARLQSSFRESKPAFVTFLEAFQPKKEKIQKSETLTALNKIISSMAMFGITRFLQLQSENLSSFHNFLPMCEQTIKALFSSISKLEAESKVSCLFHCTSLLFSTVKIVRQNTGFWLRQLQLYYEKMGDLLILESIRLTWPFLHMRQEDNTNSWKSHTSWAVFSCSFDHHAALIHLHKPTTLQHLNHNCINDMSLIQQDQFLRELGFLKALKHPNVLQLFAFHETTCPQFYVTEDYSKTSLQAVLVNRSRSSHYFSFRQLMNFLLDALEGIQYCHDKMVIHRNLTAASLFLDAGKVPRVKLSGFKYALQLAGKSFIRDYELSCLATRWSSPESLQNCCFSVASDMWMVAHMIYEILTHGCLPYYDAKMDDENLMPKVVNGQRRLSTERCIPMAINKVISSLQSINPDGRGTAHLAAVKLKDFIQSGGSSENYCKYFPDISADDHMATNHSKGPVMSVIEDYPLSGTLIPTDAQGLHSPYLNIPHLVGPKKGPVHFTERCPSSFSAKEWTVLCGEDLPSITKLIGRPQSNETGQTFLSFIIPAKSLYSLKEAVIRKVLGSSVEPYVLCLQQLANSVAYMHSRRIILCDFSADTIHVESLSNDHKILKVWISSLPMVKVLPEIPSADVIDRHVDLKVPADKAQQCRAAPEVVLHGQYSVASDVFCFGALTWWVFSTLDDHNTSVEDDEDHYMYDDVIVEGAFDDHTVKPTTCPTHIFDTLLECWQTDIYCRPRMDKIREKLTINWSHTASASDENCGYESLSVIESFTVINPSDVDSVSSRTSCTGSMLSTIKNASELSSDDDESIYELLGPIQLSPETPAKDEDLAIILPLSVDQDRKQQHCPLPPNDLVLEEKVNSSLAESQLQCQRPYCPPAPLPTNLSSEENVHSSLAASQLKLQRPYRPPAPLPKDSGTEEYVNSSLAVNLPQLQNPYRPPAPLPNVSSTEEFVNSSIAVNLPQLQNPYRPPAPLPNYSSTEEYVNSSLAANLHQHQKPYRPPAPLPKNSGTEENILSTLPANPLQLQKPYRPPTPLPYDSGTHSEENVLSTLTANPLQLQIPYRPPDPLPNDSGSEETVKSTLEENLLQRPKQPLPPLPKD